nr:hypothetical protein [Paracoccus saliphilus]
MTRLTMPLLIGALILSGCGRIGDSGWNPLRWRGSPSTPETLAPEGGYNATADARPGVPHIASANWEPLAEGRLLVARGVGPTKGYHSAALVTARSQPEGRFGPDEDGILRLRFVALPPAAGSPAARMAADPLADQIVVALPLSFRQLSRISGVEISGAGDIVTLRK